MSPTITLASVEYGVRVSFANGRMRDGIRGRVRVDGELRTVLIDALDEGYDETRRRLLAEACRRYGGG